MVNRAILIGTLMFFVSGIGNAGGRTVSTAFSSCSRKGASAHQKLADDLNTIQAKAGKEPCEDKRRDPAPVVFDRNSQECQDWLNAHKVFCGEEDYKIAKKL